MILVGIAVTVSRGTYLSTAVALLLLFGMLLSFGVTGISKWVNAISRGEKILRIAIAIIFIGIGIYYMLPWLITLFSAEQR